MIKQVINMFRFRLNKHTPNKTSET